MTDLVTEDLSLFHLANIISGDIFMYGNVHIAKLNPSSTQLWPIAGFSLVHFFMFSSPLSQRLPHEKHLDSNAWTICMALLSPCATARLSQNTTWPVLNAFSQFKLVRLRVPLKLRCSRHVLDQAVFLSSCKTRVEIEFSFSFWRLAALISILPWVPGTGRPPALLIVHSGGIWINTRV